MAKENVKKFYDLLRGSEELQKELQKRDREYAEKHGVPSDDASDEEKAEIRLAAVKDIVVPLAKEHGMEFTADELIECEKEMLDDGEGELDRSELRNVAGGGVGFFACCIVGAGFGATDDDACCFVGLGSGVCWKMGE